MAEGVADRIAGDRGDEAEWREKADIEVAL